MENKGRKSPIHCLGIGLLVCVLAMPSAFGTVHPAAQQRSGLLGPGEGETLTSWTERWLEGPAQFVASTEEKEFYESLKTVPERLQFIRLFWESRDPTPRGSENEFLVDFEQRVAYANTNFGNGEPGWDTAFGQVVLVLGAPDRTLRTSQGMRSVNSERPLVIWSYDRRITAWPVMENFIFAYRFHRWRLMPHTDPDVGDSVREIQRGWELTSNLEIVPDDFLQVQRAMIRETTLYPANYRGSIDSVRAAVAFPDAEIPFGWEARFAPGEETGVRRVDIELNLRMEAFIFHPDQEVYRTRMTISVLLVSEDGEPVAETTEPVAMEIPLDQLEARAEEIVDRTISLQAPPGTYTLELVLEDSFLGYRTVYRQTLKVPSS